MGRGQALGTGGWRLTGTASLPRAARLLLVVLATLALASCWLPDRFIAEVRLARNGDYSLTFDGEMVWVSLVEALRAGEIKGKDLDEKIAVLTRDLTRDQAFKEVVYKGNGRFKVRYERTGFLYPKDEFIFPRSNNPIISLKSRGDGTVTIRSTTLKSMDKKHITESGLGMSGKFRVVTDAMPYAGNPQAARPRGFQKFMVYDWLVKGVNDPPPVLELNMNRVVQMPDR
ncbi:MAG: hypothetical protein K9H25_06680 [Rhodospirillum sp.]|nr:hypothetical protein [Rhodospirillum sp.]MCF8487692.1 hypothetical protein [Rhodospirillum sp.]MCF8499588.1 hypothetical protein [Rhodospirillum sp.]